MIFGRCGIILLLWCCFLSAAHAGGEAENVFVVVNQNSRTSKTIANHYIRLHHVPAINVMYLDWQGDLNQCSAGEFRSEILKPILTAINERQIAAQIDYIAYSTDFPWRIDFSKEIKEKIPDLKLPVKQFSPYASITGATYLYPLALGDNPELVFPANNWYVPKAPKGNISKCEDLTGIESRAFRSRYFWSAARERIEKPKDATSPRQRYLLAAMLGVTVERGNTEKEIIRYLTAADKISGRKPEGTFYFLRRPGKPRSTPRHDCYRGVIDQLRAAGAKAEVLVGDLPEGKSDVQGLMIGIGKYDLAGANVRLQPGAFCDDLTSYGGEFTNVWQTKLSAFLRAGAAGASGTVIEPFNLQAKFPMPSLHLHYRRGCSLGEAFYQSVAGPYQLLFVGDPLCQPWAEAPKVTIESPKNESFVDGKIETKAQVVPPRGRKVEFNELFVDGRMVARYPHMLPVPLDVSKLPPGSHEIRIVASTADKMEFRGRGFTRFETGGVDGKPAVSLRITPQPIVKAGSKVTVHVEGPVDCQGIDILQNQRVVARVETSTGSVEVDTHELGSGPVALWGRAEVSEGELRPQSEPFWVIIE